MSARATRLCAFDGCERTYHAKDLCKSHWTQQYRGQPLRPLYHEPRLCDLCLERYTPTQDRARFCSVLCHSRAWQLRALYNLTVEEWRELLVQQDGCCAICHTKSDDLLHVDHDHVTGAVRGLLCQKCNHGVGLFGDDADRLIAAAEYVRKHSA